MLQWGRTFSSAEVHPVLQNLQETELSFNGAALFQVRKCTGIPTQTGFNIVLQWGRTFSSAEVEFVGWQSAGPRLLQWGRTFSSAEVNDTYTSFQRDRTLQWGRTFSSAEVLPGQLIGAPSVSASMGPHFFKCGSVPRPRRAVKFILGFNGAALFQVRKSQTGFNIVRQ